MTGGVGRRIADLSAAERTELESRLIRRRAEAGPPEISRRAGSGPAPLSFSQQRLWFLEQLYPGTPLHNMSRLIRLSGALDVAVLQRTLDAIVSATRFISSRFSHVRWAASCEARRIISCMSFVCP